MAVDLNAYLAIRKRNIVIIISLFAAVVVAAFFSAFIGQAGLGFGETFRAFFGYGNPVDVRIVWYIRMPRIVAAIVVGFGLATSGHVMQTTLQNPLASPSSLGVSHAAVFGADLAIVFGAGRFVGTEGALNVQNPFVVAILAFAFAFATTIAIVAISKLKNFSPVTVILLGVAASSLFSALTTLVQSMASDQALAAAVYWSFGDLSRASYLRIAIITACVIPSFLVFFAFRWKYNAISGGDELAASLGVRIGAVRVISLLLASLITAVSVSFVGIIGFVGIVCPQLLKVFMGSDSRYLLPASGLAGALLLIVADTLARTLVGGMDLPVGAVTAIVGTPVFVWILLRRGRR